MVMPWWRDNKSQLHKKDIQANANLDIIWRSYTAFLQSLYQYVIKMPLNREAISISQQTKSLLVIEQ